MEQDLHSEPLLSVPPGLTSSAAPSLSGLPVRDGEGEQRRGLHEEEFPGDARLYEALQPAHHPRGCPHAEVRQTRGAHTQDGLIKRLLGVLHLINFWVLTEAGKFTDELQTEVEPCLSAVSLQALLP